MGWSSKATIAAIATCLSFTGHPLIAQDSASGEADAVLANCFGAPANADKAIVRNVCLRAFDGAIAQAQRAQVHSRQKQNLYWVQASQAAGILVVLFVERDGGFKQSSCATAYRGWQSWNQADAEFKASSGVTVSQALQASINHCQAHWERGEWQ